jgi:hypothetical protein
MVQSGTSRVELEIKRLRTIDELINKIALHLSAPKPIKHH